MVGLGDGRKGITKVSGINWNNDLKFSKNERITPCPSISGGPLWKNIQKVPEKIEEGWGCR